MGQGEYGRRPFFYVQGRLKSVLRAALCVLRAVGSQ